MGDGIFAIVIQQWHQLSGPAQTSLWKALSPAEKRAVWCDLTPRRQLQLYCNLPQQEQNILAEEILSAEEKQALKDELEKISNKL